MLQLPSEPGLIIPLWRWADGLKFSNSPQSLNVVKHKVESSFVYLPSLFQY